MHCHGRVQRKWLCEHAYIRIVCIISLSQILHAGLLQQPQIDRSRGGLWVFSTWHMLVHAQHAQMRALCLTCAGGVREDAVT